MSQDPWDEVTHWMREARNALNCNQVSRATAAIYMLKLSLDAIKQNINDADRSEEGQPVHSSEPEEIQAQPV